MKQKLTTVQYIEAAERYTQGGISLVALAQVLGVADSTLHRKFFGPSQWHNKYQQLLPNMDKMRLMARQNQECSNAKISSRIARKVRVARENGQPAKAIATALDMTRRNVYNICNKQIWVEEMSQDA